MPLARRRSPAATKLSVTTILLWKAQLPDFVVESFDFERWTGVLGVSKKFFIQLISSVGQFLEVLLLPGELVWVHRLTSFS